MPSGLCCAIGCTILFCWCQMDSLNVWTYETVPELDDASHSIGMWYVFQQFRWKFTFTMHKTLLPYWNTATPYCFVIDKLDLSVTSRTGTWSHTGPFNISFVSWISKGSQYTVQLIVCLCHSSLFLVFLYDCITALDTHSYLFQKMRERILHLWVSSYHLASS